MNRYFKHLKTGKVYILLGLGTDCSTVRAHKQYAIYKNQESDTLFLREWQEFLEKFEEV